MRLIHGDCLEVLPSIPSGSVDMVLADPPYQLTRCKWDSMIPLEPMWEQLKRVIKPNGAIVLTSAQPFTTALISSNYKMFKEALVWEKDAATGHLNANRRHMRAHEDILIFSPTSPVYYPQKQRSTPMHSATSKTEDNSQCYNSAKGKTYGGETLRYPRSVLKFTSVNNNSERLHPTQKPVLLMEYLIRTYTNEGDTVLDFTMGSGTTGVAAFNTDRQFIGIEKDLKYFNIAKQRINLAIDDKEWEL